MTKKHLKDKRVELIWALANQDYENVEIATIFNLNRSSVMRIINKKPKNWKTKWIKV